MGPKPVNHTMRVQSFTSRLFALIMLFSGDLAFGQSHEISLFTDIQEYRRALASAPKAVSIDSDLSLIEAHVNGGLGAEFNTPMSLTAVFCDRKTSRFAIEAAITSTLKAESFNIPIGWDNFGFLTAKKGGRALIFKVPPQYEKITLRIKFDQGDLNERAITIDYEIRASVRENDQGSWTDQSASDAAREFVDDLRGKLKGAAEAALKSSCKKVTVKDIKSKEAGIDSLASEAKLSSSQVQAVKSAVGKQNE
jgi:hypothetical protein